MAKKGEISMYEIQNVNKPELKDACYDLLSDAVLKDGMARLIALSGEVRMKPCWTHTNNWNCTYKGKRVASYQLGGGGQMILNRLVIRVSVKKNELNDFLMSLSDEMSEEFINGMRCHGCGGCKPGKKIEILGKQQIVCYRTDYCRVNPTTEQFRWIEQFIHARRKHIIGEH